MRLKLPSFLDFQQIAKWCLLRKWYSKWTLGGWKLGSKTERSYCCFKAKVTWYYTVKSQQNTVIDYLIVDEKYSKFAFLK